MITKKTLIRDIEYRGQMEVFIISAIAAILSIRLFLSFTHFPTIGGRFFHISHMLWGGLLMVFAMMLLLIFLDRDIKRVSAVIGGLGFGTFIDEIGKFITRDNNYFYKPSFALMYITFVLIYLALHLFNRKRKFSKKEYLINSIELMKEAVINDLDTQEKQKALLYLSRSEKNDPISHTLKTLYMQLETIHPPDPSIFRYIQTQTKKFYIALINKPGFRNLLIAFFLIQAGVSLAIAVLLLIEKNAFTLPALLLSHSFSSDSFNKIHFISTFISAVFIFFGIIQVYISRLDAYIWFKRAILVSILLSQVFGFYFDPTRAFATFLFNILILTTLNYMIDNEKELKNIT
ncbi:hypothetical protein BH09PAT2_BH09PAT2_11190 [soil metagenome]